MKKFLVLIIAGLALAGYLKLPVDASFPQFLPSASSAPRATAEVRPQSESALALAYRQQAQERQLIGEGRVVKILADDTQGSKHQRFILRVPEGFTVLVAHNIDLAPRIEKLAVGDSVAFNGEYVWNDKGGVMHWTHRDPRGRHPSGWLKHNGVTYQ